MAREQLPDQVFELLGKTVRATNIYRERFPDVLTPYEGPFPPSVMVCSAEEARDLIASGLAIDPNDRRNRHQRRKAKARKR